MKKKLQLKRNLATFAALLCLMTMMPLSAWAANVINTVISSEQLTKTSTVYVGEVVVDGETKMKYLYSGDVTTSSLVTQNLLAALRGMADGDYADLLEENWKESDSQQIDNFAFCSDPELAASMDENWSNAQYVGAQYFSGKSVTSEINSNLYDIDDGFKAAVDALTEERIADIDTPIEAEKCIVSHLGTNSNSSVYFTLENGEIIKHVDTHVVFLSEATTVIYTKVELGTASNPDLGDVNGDGKIDVSDVVCMVNYILENPVDVFILENADIDNNTEVNITDVTMLVNIILNRKDE